ncbi:MAG TPA: endonuclease/exonuclease/phosphatase family protein [Actinomycetota bacterium]|nr:endonuclease/exonuclease/phosphatase family protein [Actinomycetota bacterium]
MNGGALRVATWNVHGMRAGVEEIARVIRAEQVDIVAMQESGPRRRLRAVGETLDMQVCGDPWAFPRRRIQNAVLVRRGLATTVSHRLHRFSGGSLLYPRGVLLAETDLHVSVLSVHLGLDSSERADHVEQLRAMLLGPDATFVVVGGDLNALPGDPGPSSFAALASDCWAAASEGSGATFPSHAPTARIDYLFAGRAFRPLRAWTVGGTVSDHLMVVAELAFTETGEDGASVRGS